MHFTCERLHCGGKLPKCVILKGFSCHCMEEICDQVLPTSQNLHDFVNITGCSLETVEGRMLGHISLERYTIWLTAAVD